jgi:Lipocalin-like domain
VTTTVVSSTLIGLVGLLVGAGSAAQPSAADIQKRLVGHWRLVGFVNIDEKGVERPGAYDAGRIMYDAHGNMAAQLSRNGRAKLGAMPSEAERAAAYSGFLAYYGRYTVDTGTGRVTHHVEGSTNPNWPGTDLVRYYAFSADDSRLMLSLKNAEGRITGTLTWERMR